MTPLSQILNLERTLYLPEVSSKKKTLDLLSEAYVASVPRLKPREIFDALVARERLGNTALGKGVALPHCPIEGITDPIACFMLLKDGVDFDAADARPVDIVMALLVPPTPHEQHLMLLASVASVFSQEAYLATLRAAPSKEVLYDTLTRAL